MRRGSGWQRERREWLVGIAFDSFEVRSVALTEKVVWDISPTLPARI